MLPPKQARFARMVALLILFAEQLGYHVTFGDAFAKTGHKDGSFHYKRLAIDLNLFDSKFNYLALTKDHEPLGEFWKSIGGTWGGDFKREDGNHYSLDEK